MTVEEAKQLAQRGDVRAMSGVGLIITPNVITVKMILTMPSTTMSLRRVWASHRQSRKWRKPLE